MNGKRFQLSNKQKLIRNCTILLLVVFILFFVKYLIQGCPNFTSKQALKSLEREYGIRTVDWQKNIQTDRDTDRYGNKYVYYMGYDSKKLYVARIRKEGGLQYYPEEIFEQPYTELIQPLYLGSHDIEGSKQHIFALFNKSDEVSKVELSYSYTYVVTQYTLDENGEEIYSYGTQKEFTTQLEKESSDIDNITVIVVEQPKGNFRYKYNYLPYAHLGGLPEGESEIYNLSLTGYNQENQVVFEDTFYPNLDIEKDSKYRYGTSYVKPDYE